MMMKWEGILTARSTEPDTIVQFVQMLFQRNDGLKIRTRVLEVQGEK
ncbi:MULTISPECIES: hypothetical protein [Bacillus cereus group]|nr:MULTISPECIES: hypothetical protein [Bacillus cereus group]MDH2865590.1 hypothetical protein [Bacillus cytotoxicus]MDH2882532.1 hypothetical protein [Bacillus cytotoxicus]MDH2885605.1 hypothetical protein [Bacillus cytotoxicus]MDH2890294.1 hypothetical protein [Bacillus cytotoxicus]NZD34899.1 hypothetical protein [Bacillus cytotoxicus]